MCTWILGTIWNKIYWKNIDSLWFCDYAAFIARKDIAKYTSCDIGEDSRWVAGSIHHNYFKANGRYCGSSSVAFLDGNSRMSMPVFAVL